MDSRIENLKARSEHLRASLACSQNVTAQVCTILDGIDEKTAQLEELMLPIQEKVQTLRRAHINLDDTVQVMDSMLQHFNIHREVEGRISEGPRDDFTSYLRCIEQLDTAMNFLECHSAEKTTTVACKLTKELRYQGLLKCEDRFRSVIWEYANPLELRQVEAQFLPQAPPEPARARRRAATADSASTSAPTGLPLGAGPADGVKRLELMPAHLTEQLQQVAKRLISGGRENCLKDYKNIRADVVESSLRALDEEGRDQWNPEEARTHAPVGAPAGEGLEARIAAWGARLRAGTALFAAELELARAVLPGQYSQSSFAAVTKASAEGLLASGADLVRSKKQPEKVLALLDMRAHLASMLPHLLGMLSGKACAEVARKFRELLQFATAAARDTFQGFLAAVEHDTSRAEVANASVHPLTSYVLNYLKRVQEFPDALHTLFGSSPEQPHPVPGQESQVEEAMAGAVVRIVEVLAGNLDGKAQHLKSKALASLFLMNNQQYLVKALRRMRVMEMHRAAWIRTQQAAIDQYAQDYKHHSWTKVLECLNDERLQRAPSGAQRLQDPNDDGDDDGGGGAAAEDLAGWLVRDKDKKLIKEKLKSVNTHLEGLIAVQAKWHVPDAALRESLRESLRSMLLPPYAAFVTRALNTNFTKKPFKYIKYKAPQVERMLAFLFENKAKDFSFDHIAL